MGANKKREQQKQERLGMSKINSEGELMTIIEYNSSIDMVVEFENKKTIKCAYSQFKKGNLLNNKNRLGDINYNNKNQKLTIIRYNSAIDIDVLIEDGCIKQTTYGLFKQGIVYSDLLFDTITNKFYNKNEGFKQCTNCLKVLKENSFYNKKDGVCKKCTSNINKLKRRIGNYALGEIIPNGFKKCYKCQ